jgi:hypothetical protein
VPKSSFVQELSWLLSPFHKSCVSVTIVDAYIFWLTCGHLCQLLETTVMNAV